MIKTLILSAILFLFCYQTQAQVLGTINNEGDPTLTFSSSEILDSWNELLSSSDLDVTLTAVTIEKRGDLYLLVARGSGYKSTSLLTLNTSTGELSLATIGGVKVSCTTKACANTHGCEATPDGLCSVCTIDSQDCTKSTSNSNYLF